MASPKIFELGRGYCAEVDALDEAAWCQLLEKFDDANIYQTWSYDEVRGGRQHLSHLVLKEDGEVVAVAQARIAKLPLLKAGVAYVRWGPMWRRQNTPVDGETFRQAIRALHNEYAVRRGLVLRLYPILFRESAGELISILAQERFASVVGERTDRTLLLDLTPSIEDLRKGLRSHWTRYLKVAEKNQLEIIEGTGDELFGMFIGIYREMVGRKRFAEPNDIEEFRSIQKRLPEHLKMRLLLCKSEGKLCAGLICSAIGKTGVYLFGATSNLGLKSRGSYLLHWTLIGWLKQNGVATYDLHGIDPVTNPGTYKFKADLCGNNGKDVHFLGRFDSYSNSLSHAIVACGDGVRSIVRNLRKKMSDRSGSTPARDSGQTGPLAPRNA